MTAVSLIYKAWDATRDAVLLTRDMAVLAVANVYSRVAAVINRTIVKRLWG